MCLGSTDTLEGPPGPAPFPPFTTNPFLLPTRCSRHWPPTSLRSAHIFIIYYWLSSHGPARAVDLRMRRQDITKFHSPITFLKIKPEQLPGKEVGEEEAETRDQTWRDGPSQLCARICGQCHFTGEKSPGQGSLDPSPPLPGGGGRGVLASTRLFSCIKWK